MKARVREDLNDNELIPPIMTQTGKLIYDASIFEKEFECFQPDSWDKEEFNLILFMKNGEFYKAMSIDFDFEE